MQEEESIKRVSLINMHLTGVLVLVVPHGRVLLVVPHGHAPRECVPHKRTPHGHVPHRRAPHRCVCVPVVVLLVVVLDLWYLSQMTIRTTWMRKAS